MNDLENGWPVDSKDDEKISTSEETDEQCKPWKSVFNDYADNHNQPHDDNADNYNQPHDDEAYGDEEVPVELAEEDALPGESPDRVDRDIPYIWNIWFSAKNIKYRD